MSTETTHQICCNLPSPLYLQMKRLAKRVELPVSALIRECLISHYPTLASELGAIAERLRADTAARRKRIRTREIKRRARRKAGHLSRSDAVKAKRKKRVAEKGRKKKTSKKAAARQD